MPLHHDCWAQANHCVMWADGGFVTAAYLINWCGSELCGFNKLSPALRMIFGHLEGGLSHLS